MEQPVDLKPSKGKSGRKKSRATSDRICIVHFDSTSPKDEINPVSEQCFETIKNAVKVRLSHADAKHRLEEICNNMPDSLDDSLHGSHRRCYRLFTNTQRLARKRASDVADSTEDPQPSTSKLRRTSSSLSVSSPLFPQDKCIFCDKEFVKVKGKRQKLVTCVTQVAKDSIFAAAMAKNDESLLCKIRDQDIVAREARYHHCCRKNYTRQDTRNPKSQNTEYLNITQAHADSFKYICDYIEDSIIIGQKVERLTMLRERYMQYMLEHHPTVYNQEYRSFKLKEKLVHHFGSRLNFWQPSSKSQLVFGSDIKKGQSVEVAFELACSDEKRLEEAAMILRRHIDFSKRISGDMPWPPSQSWLLSNERQPPVILKEFLSFVISSKSLQNASEKTFRQVNSIAQDICYTATHGEWVMPKHILLPMSVRHLTGSAEVITILNRFGHGQSYTKTLEIETAMCNTITASKSVLPSNISTERNSVIHFCWDNFDLNEETPSGAGTTHSTHGIVIQEVTEEAQTIESTETPTIERRKIIEPNVSELKPCFAKPKAEPNLVISHSEPEFNFNSTDFLNFIWLACRNRNGSCGDRQIVPSWTGWLSQTSAHSNDLCSIVEYMPPINFSINENSTVQHVLELSQEASMKVGQQYTIVTFDLAVAKKAYSIVWQNPRQFGNVIVRMGVFHTICSLFGAIGSKMKGSGLSEILIEAGVCASGSLEKVMSGKHFNRALRVHKLTVEALERLLLCKFENSDSMGCVLSDEAKELFESLTESPSPHALQEVMKHKECKAYFDAYQKFKQTVRAGDLGRTAQFWLSYMDTIWMILALIKATKTNDLALHIAALYNLCPVLFAFDHNNYARYLPVYLMTIMNLSKTHPGSEHLLQNNGFSVCRSTVPLARNPVDITIEQTINRHAKCQGGIIGFSRNFSAYYRWCVTRHYRAKLVEATLGLADMASDDSTLHKELQPSQIRNSESDTRKLVEAFNSFTNPFNAECLEELFCLSSGKPASKEVKEDLLSADEKGRTAMKAFIKDRLVDKSVPFHEPIKRMKLKTFASACVVKKVRSSENKLIQIKAERNVFGQLVLLSVENNIDLVVTLSYPLGPVPFALATADGMPVKTEKAKLMHNLELGIEPATKPPESETVYVYDGNATLQSLVSIPDSFDALAMMVFNLLPKVPRVDFVTDTYSPMSIKSFERKKRGNSPKFMLSGPKTKTPRDWKGFMSNDDNKTQLIKLLLDEWQKDAYAEKLIGRKVIFVCGEECFCLSSVDGETVTKEPQEELFSSQEEADTRIILHCLQISQNSSDNTHIVVRSPDTDVFVLLLRFAQTIKQPVIFDTGVANKRRLLNVKEIIERKGPDVCSVLPSIHSFTGCDTTSAFVRRGKLIPLKNIEKNQSFLNVFDKLGKTLDVTEDLLSELEKYVCSMYGKPKYSDVNKLRYDLFAQKYQGKSGQLLSNYDGVDLSLLPPCRDSLEMHIKRANYQAYIWLHADQRYPEVPSPVGHGWKLEDNSIDYEWTSGYIFPQELVDIMCSGRSTDTQDDDSEEVSTEVESMIDEVYENESDDDTE